MDLKDCRRQLHKIAEVGDTLPMTQEFIVNALKGCACEISYPWKSAVAAFFDLGQNRTIALRADMDAITVCESIHTDYRSQNPSVMHACGHDGHMAMLLGVADRLRSVSVRSSYNILLVFQPAEETTGGAEPITGTGIFEKYNVQYVFGMHLMPDLRKSTLYTRPGALMAKSCEITVDIAGVSAHIAKYSEGIDTIPAAAEFITQLYSAVEAMNDIEYKLLRFGKVESGTVRNALSAHTRLEGSLRCFDESDYDKLVCTAREILSKTDKLYGTSSKMHLSTGYPPVINDAELVSKLSGFLDIHPLEKPLMLTDDFSQYQKRVPGVYIYLGTGTGIALHSGEFDFDEQILKTGVDAYIKIIENL